METTPIELSERETPETLLEWMVVCPERQRLAEVDIATRAVPFATYCCPRLTVRRCSFWSESDGCQQICLQSTPEPIER